MSTPLLPENIRFIERDWLSANMIVIEDTVIDTGYFTHRDMTEQLVTHAFEKTRPKRIINTHLHSDHCGGNARLQALYPAIETWVPASSLNAIQTWDHCKLTYHSTAQDCEPFTAEFGMSAGQEIQIGAHRFNTIATGGHDKDMFCLYCEKEALLISADALWGDGFGVLFDFFEGLPGVDRQRETLQHLSALDVRCVMPGHGPMFNDFSAAIERAQRRVDYLAQDPLRVWRNGLRVLIKFRLLADKKMSETQLQALVKPGNLPAAMVHALSTTGQPASACIAQATQELVRAGVAHWNDSYLVN